MLNDPMTARERPAAPGHNERRRHPRYSFTAAVQAVDTAQRSVLNARISDLGAAAVTLMRSARSL